LHSVPTAHNGTHEPHANRRLPPGLDRQASRPRSQPRRAAAKVAAYAELYDLELVEVVVDAGASAKTLDRPGLVRALGMLRRGGEAEALLVVKLDRLTRSVRDLGELVERHFAPGKAALLSVGEQIDTRGAAGRLVLNIREDASKYATWLSPRIGHLAITAPREELANAIEELRDDLNAAVRAYVKRGKAERGDTSRTSGKNAALAWGVLVTGFNCACKAERRSGLRVRSDNPCDGIRAPEKSPPKYKTVLRPTEWLSLAQCDRIHADWRETYAVMLYEYLRPGEGRVLEWETDVDFITNKIRVSKASQATPQRREHFRQVETRSRARAHSRGRRRPASVGGHHR
jgi:hypothetical protein